MNVYDSNRMADIMHKVGYHTVNEPHNADMVILNTCHIREQASEKLFSELGRFRKVKSKREAEGATMIIAVAGCVAQAAGNEIIKRAPYVDIILGPQTYHRLPEMVAEVSGSKRKNKDLQVVDLEFPKKTKFDYLPKASVAGPSAFLSIQEGCDKFCTFCVVPYTRGAEYSRSIESILGEAKQLIESGTKEITLLGQNVNAYHGLKEHSTRKQEFGLGYLIRRIAEINGLKRLRYITSHPKDMNDDLISAHGEVELLMPFLHLPVQSGSDQVLERMNRQHKVKDYILVVEKLLSARPELRLSSDFIVGFPGESDADFEATITLIREIKFLQSYSFKFSPRPGTPGATLKNQIPNNIKDSRLALLQDILLGHQSEFNKSSIGKTVPVLFDRRGRVDGQLLGRTKFMQPVHAKLDDNYMGQVSQVTIDTATSNSLGGSVTK